MQGVGIDDPGYLFQQYDSIAVPHRQNGIENAEDPSPRTSVKIVQCTCRKCTVYMQDVT